jgi:hypothetical protein
MQVSLLPILLYVLIGCAIAVVGMILFMLLVDSTGRRSAVGSGSIFGGILILFLATRGLFVGYSALRAHTVLYQRINPAHPWLDPWQAILGSSLICLVGLHLLIRGVRQKRANRNDSGEQLKPSI